jgi:dethiobiotin synthetase
MTSGGLTLPRIWFVTGTDTGVGKTIVTAALAVALSRGGRDVAVYKPTQAGLEDGDGDIDTVRRLAGLQDVHEGIRLRHPMAPVAAAEMEGVALPSIDSHLNTIGELARGHDHVLVEGAGGVLVKLDSYGHTLPDIASLASTNDTGSVGALIVCRAALGTLNHTELTFEALQHRGVPTTGLVIGAWPAEPDGIEMSNRRYMAHHTAPLFGSVPTGAGSLTPEEFQARASGWLPGLTGKPDTRAAMTTSV